MTEPLSGIVYESRGQRVGTVKDIDIEFISLAAGLRHKTDRCHVLAGRNVPDDTIQALRAVGITVVIDGDVDPDRAYLVEETE